MKQILLLIALLIPVDIYAQTMATDSGQTRETRALQLTTKNFPSEILIRPNPNVKNLESYQIDSGGLGITNYITIEDESYKLAENYLTQIERKHPHLTSGTPESRDKIKYLLAALAKECLVY